MAGQGYPDDAVPDLLYSKGRPKIYDTTVAAAGTPNTHDVNTDLGHNGHSGYLMNDSPTGDIYLYISDDGVNFNGGVSEASTEKIVIKPTEGFDFGLLDIDSIKVDSSISGVAYRIVIW